MSIVQFDADEAEWVGDEQDGCYVQVGSNDDGWYYTVVVDCDTAKFVEDLQRQRNYADIDDSLHEHSTLLGMILLAGAKNDR